MPVLRMSRRERFVRLVAAGATLEAAYRAAGYRVRGQQARYRTLGRRLLAEPEVNARVAELSAAGAEEHSIERQPTVSVRKCALRHRMHCSFALPGRRWWARRRSDTLELRLLQGSVMKKVALILCVLATLTAACAPEPGSKAWCEMMDEKPKGDWSANEAAEYAKSCLLGNQEEQ